MLPSFPATKIWWYIVVKYVFSKSCCGEDFSKPKYWAEVQHSEEMKMKLFVTLEIQYFELREISLLTRIFAL